MGMSHCSWNQVVEIDWFWVAEFEIIIMDLSEFLKKV
jgi:hypothetical protein